METKVSQKGIENTGLVEGKIKEDIVEENVVEPEEKKNE